MVLEILIAFLKAAKWGLQLDDIRHNLNPELLFIYLALTNCQRTIIVLQLAEIVYFQQIVT